MGVFLIKKLARISRGYEYTDVSSFKDGVLVDRFVGTVAKRF